MPFARAFPLRWLFWPLLAITVAYAVTLVWATHHPRPQDLIGPNAPSDKTLHFTAYGLLGLLTAATLAVSGRWSLRRAVMLGVGLALAAVVDESTQPFFGRAAETLDWVFDVIGISLGIAAVAVARAVVRRILGRPQ